jgi:putative FmdB family regulatory protein
MPLYEYECCECGEKQELIRKIKDAEKPVFCEKCDGQCRQVVAKPGRFVRGRGDWSSPA